MQLKAKDKEEEKKIKQCRGEVAAGVLITFNQTTSLPGEPLCKVRIKNFKSKYQDKIGQNFKQGKHKVSGCVARMRGPICAQTKPQLK